MKVPSTLLILAVLAGAPAVADTILLSDPYSAVCVTSPQAQYTVVNGGLRPVRGEFSIAAHGLVPLQPRFLGTTSAQPGQLVRMYLATAEPIEGVKAEVRGPGNRLLAHGAGFTIPRDGEDSLWVILVGIPASASAGTYSLAVSASSGTRSWQSLRDFDVLSREFFSERLSLTSELTSLVTAPDPRKMAESKTLSEVLSTPHADALYEIGALADPLPGARRTSGYGDRRVYEYSDGSADTSTHFGIDIASPTGTPIPASGRGRVVFAARRILTGNTVIIEHLPGLYSIYYHMSSLSVAVGDVVAKGAIIGTVGMTGFATGPHLHWEVQVSGTAVDPDGLTRAALLDKEPGFPDIEIHSTGEGR